MSRVLTVGVFDLVHFGHFELFRKCKALAGEGGELIVGVQDDEHVRKYKPHVKLVYPYEVRRSLVSDLRMVDRVIRHTDVDETVKSVDFDVFCVGGDQGHDGFRRALAWCEANGKEVVRIPRTKGISSTLLREDADALCRNLLSQFFDIDPDRIMDALRGGRPVEM